MKNTLLLLAVWSLFVGLPSHANAQDSSWNDPITPISVIQVAPEQDLPSFDSGLSGYTLDKKASNGVLGDCGTTFVGLLLGAVELNPINPVLGCGLRKVILDSTKELSLEERAQLDAMNAAVGNGATANNVCIVAAIITGGTFAPACIAVGFTMGMNSWQQMREETEFWGICSRMRKEKPFLHCVYKPTNGKGAFLEDEKEGSEKKTASNLREEFAP